MKKLKKNEKKREKTDKNCKKIEKNEKMMRNSKNCMSEKNKLYWKIGVLCAIVVAALVLDLVTKYVLDAKMDFEQTWTIIPKLFNFKLVHNFGAAWGMLAGKQAFLIVFSIVFLAIFVFYYCKEKNKTWLLTVAFALLVAGCLGNLYDRIFLGFVRDFIQFDFWQNFPIFNFADVALTFGVLLFVIYLVLYFVRAEKDKQAQKAPRKDKTDLINAKNSNDFKEDINGGDIDETNATSAQSNKNDQDADKKADTTSTNSDDKNEQN